MRTIKIFIATVYQNVISDKVTEAAAAISYYALVSLIPMMLVLISVFSSQELIEPEQQVKAVDFLWRCVNSFIPNASMIINEKMVASSIQKLSGSGGQVGTAGFAMLLWSATLVLAGFVQNINQAWHSAKHRHFIADRIVGVLIVGLIAIQVIVIQFFTTVNDFIPGFGKLNQIIVSTQNWVNNSPRLLIFFPQLPEKLKSIHIGTGNIRGNMTSFHSFILNHAPYMAMFVGFMILYKLIPTVKVKWREALGGTLFVIPLLRVLRYLFVKYFDMFGNESYSAIYGSMGAVIAFMLWIYLASTVILIGGHISAVIALLTRPEELPLHRRVTDLQETSVC